MILLCWTVLLSAQVFNKLSPRGLQEFEYLSALRELWKLFSFLSVIFWHYGVLPCTYCSLYSNEETLIQISGASFTYSSLLSGTLLCQVQLLQPPCAQLMFFLPPKMICKRQAESLGNGRSHLIWFPSLRSHKFALSVSQRVKTGFYFPYILSSFLVVYSMRASSIVESTNQKQSFSSAILASFQFLKKKKKIRLVFALKPLHLLFLLGNSSHKSLQAASFSFFIFQKKSLLTILFKVIIYHNSSFLLSFIEFITVLLCFKIFCTCIISPLSLLRELHRERNVFTVLPYFLASWMVSGP